MIRVYAALAGLLLANLPARADKKITFEVKHPPALATALAGKLVTPGQLTGDCAKGFGELLFRDMRAHDVPMASASRSGSAAPGITVSVNATRCEGRPQQPILGEGLPAVHISRTEGWFVAEIRAVDSASGRQIAAVTVHGHAQKENESQTGSPEWPAPSELKSMAVLQAITEARRLYAPWTEKRELSFMDSKDCHLKQAYDLAKSGDYEALVKQARANAEACAGKAAMEAWYDLGVADFVTHHYDDAAAAFQKALDLKGTKLVGGLLEESRKAAEMVKAQQQAQTAAAAPSAAVQTGMVMTNDLVIKLVDGNVAEAEILKMIANQPGRFSFEPADMARLKAAAVPDSIVAAMRGKKTAP